MILLGMSVLEPELEQLRELTRPRGRRQKHAAGPRPLTERAVLQDEVWNMMLANHSFAEIAEHMEEQYDLPLTTTRYHYDKLARRLAETLQDKQEQLWARQVRRLESSAVLAKKEGRYEAQAMLEGALMKVAGTAAPEKFLHLHAQVDTVDMRAEELDRQLRDIASAKDGPKAVAHEISVTQASALEVHPNKPPEGLPVARALRGRPERQRNSMKGAHEALAARRAEKEAAAKAPASPPATVEPPGAAPGPGAAPQHGGGSPGRSRLDALFGPRSK